MWALSARALFVTGAGSTICDMTWERQAERSRQELLTLCHRGLDVARFFEAAGRALGRAVPFDGVCWVTMDPATLLVTGHIPQGSFQPEEVPRLAHNEYLEDDVNKFSALARQERTAGILREATGGEPERSARYRELLTPKGFDDELRTAFVDGSTCWGAAAMYRERGRSGYDPADRELLADIAGYMAAGLRRAILIGALPTEEAFDGPGLVLLCDDNKVEAITPGAERWLAALIGSRAPGTLPEVVYAVASRARQIGRGGEEVAVGVARARIQAPSGQWLVLHGSMLETSSGMRTAIIVEPARPLEIAPLIVEAYGMTERERDIVGRIVQGLSTNEIAETLYLSPYTVQDHLKAVFQKVGVNSRRELVAQMFFQHYAPRMARADNLATDGWFASERHAAPVG
jgi:DNA-binding CsgD family transcriptional regulator